MFSDEEKTYQGRKFIQGLQVALVVAIGVFSFISLSGPRTDDTPLPPSTPYPTVAVPTSIPRSTVTVPTATPDNSAAAFYNRGRYAHDQDKPELAIELYTQAIELDPKMTNAWLSRGVTYEQSNADERLSRNDFWRYLQIMETERIEREIINNEPLELEMSEGLVYALSFEAQAGDKLEITASSVQEGQPGDEDVVDPLALLFDSKDALVRGDDDTHRSDGTVSSMDSRIDDYRVKEDGTYTLLITHAGGGSYGMIDVTLSVR